QRRTFLSIFLAFESDPVSNVIIEPKPDICCCASSYCGCRAIQDRTPASLSCAARGTQRQICHFCRAAPCVQAGFSLREELTSIRRERVLLLRLFAGTPAFQPARVWCKQLRRPDHRCGR